MTHRLLMIAVFAAATALAAAIPTMAVAGIHAVPVAAEAVSAKADACAESTAEGRAENRQEAPSLVIVTCKKKAQAGKLMPCPQAHALVPAALAAPAASDTAVTAPKSVGGFTQACPERLHRPPRV